MKKEKQSVPDEEISLKDLVEGIISENGIKQEFDEETLAEAEKIPSAVTDEQLRGREDLRDMLIFTIDGDDARDFDDAISLTLTENGNYMLGVHIADVSEYVKENSPLDNEAYERGTSVYLPDRVIPMLPEKLSNGICSLNPRVDRLTMSVFMEISGSGEIVNSRLCRSVINSKERMTYNNVNKILDDSDDELCERCNYMLPTLRLMESLAAILNKKRVRRGAIEFEFPEMHIVTDENGEPIEISREVRGVSNKMIEEFMLAANETVAELAAEKNLPFVYRVHEPPSLEKMRSLNTFLAGFGLSLSTKVEHGSVPPKSLQAVLDRVSGLPEESVISRVMLQSLMKARYTNENLGHFGLAAQYYCHFTSPIRRYPDLAVHRILKEYLDGTLNKKRITHLKKYTAEASLRSSDREVTAQNAEYACDDLLTAAYMNKFVGEAFDAVISGVTGFGMFAELENGAEGLIPASSMRGDYYELDEKTLSLVGKRKKKRYSVGDCVRIVVTKADVVSRYIDFMLEKDYEKKAEKAAKNKPHGKKSAKKPHKKNKKKR